MWPIALATRRRLNVVLRRWLKSAMVETWNVQTNAFAERVPTSGRVPYKLLNCHALAPTALFQAGAFRRVPTRPSSGFLWISMDFYGFLWIFMDFYRFS